MKLVRGTADARRTTIACGKRSAAPDARRSGLRPAAVAAGLAAAVLAGGAFPAPAAHAQTAAATVNADIPAGPLGEALSRFAAQAGVTVQADPAMVRGKTSPGLKGATTVEDGLRRLLAGSGHGIARTASGYAVVAQSAAAPASSPDSTTLPALQVTANAGLMTGGLAQPYAGGRSRAAGRSACSAAATSWTRPSARSTTPPT